MTDDALPQSDCIDGVAHPREAEQVYGQSDAQATFLKAYNSDRLHHAWMVTGPRGIGKATLVWKLATFLLSQDAQDGALFGANDDAATSLDVAPDHPIKRRIAALSEPRLYLCRRAWDDKAKRLKRDITVAETRALKSFFSLSAADGGWRVAIVDSIDEMNSSAANALLKILEEPPEKTIFFLVSHQPARLLPTIRSRCRALRCKTLSPADLTQILQTSDMDAATNPEALAQLADGSAGEAIRIMSEDGLRRYAQLTTLIAGAPDMDRVSALSLANDCIGAAKAARYDLTLTLLERLLYRLARFAALQPDNFQAAASNEAGMMTKLGGNPQDARKWADLSAQLNARISHARAVNLDPSGVILDMLLKINETARG